MDKKRIVFWALTIISILIPLIPFSIAAYAQGGYGDMSCRGEKDCQGDVIWTATLLFIPYLIQLGMAFYGYWRIREQVEESFMFGFFVLSLISLFPYSLAWALFNWEGSPGSLAYLWLVLIGLLVVMVALLTYLLVHPEHSFPMLEKYIRGLKQLHFCAVMHFFAIFLSIAYLAGFAFAYHDRANNRNDFYMEKLKLEANGGSSSDLPGYPNGACFYFDPPSPLSSGANLTISDQKPLSSEIGTDKYIPKTQARTNYESLVKLITYIDHIKKEEGQKIPMIRMVGKADTNRPSEKGAYSNNFDLSDARIREVRRLLTEELSKVEYPLLNIIWELNAVSSDKNTTLFPLGATDICGQIGPDPNSNKRIVEVKIVPQTHFAPIERAPLTTIDYMYFSLYTITTTGYGDIKPITAYAKFVCSMENIIEVFFLVIFINVLINIRKDNENKRSLPG